jgi:hypothetical protein
MGHEEGEESITSVLEKSRLARAALPFTLTCMAPPTEKVSLAEMGMATSLFITSSVSCGSEKRSSHGLTRSVSTADKLHPPPHTHKGRLVGCKAMERLVKTKETKKRSWGMKKAKNHHVSLGKSRRARAALPFSAGLELC